MKKIYYVFIAITGLLIASAIVSCQKIKYNTINEAAYLRVFNDLNYTLTLANKDQPLPFLTMLIDPDISSNGTIKGAATIGDFLDVRSNYAPPYPAHAGNTGFRNLEYPGQDIVLVGPILNGYDLSSWAQVPSGKHHFMFISRPLSPTAFLNLAPETRSTKDKILIDTIVTLKPGEVYTMEALTPDANSNKVGLYLRNEQFTKQAFSDSLVYVNFYNLSSKGYWQKYLGVYDNNDYLGRNVSAIKDTMNVYLSLLYPDSISVDIVNNYMPVPGFNANYMGSIFRTTKDNRVSPYFSFPLFPDLGTNHINTKVYELFQFFAPGYSSNIHYPGPGVYNGQYPSYPYYTYLTCSWNDYTNGKTPNLIISIPSGNNNPESFGTINTIEIINGRTYTMTVQRKYAPPVIH